MTSQQMIITDFNFWDCSCQHKYIRHKFSPTCPRCGDEREDGPDSRVNDMNLDPTLISRAISDINSTGGDNYSIQAYLSNDSVLSSGFDSDISYIAVSKKDPVLGDLSTYEVVAKFNVSFFNEAIDFYRMLSKLHDDNSLS